MSEIILHHHPGSPYSERVRLVFGLKSIEWDSVMVPLLAPKPNLALLTGGYARVPVMQIGADVYCDSQRIIQELELRYPSPSIHPKSSGALGYMAAQWAQRSFQFAASDAAWATSIKGASKATIDSVESIYGRYFESLDEPLLAEGTDEALPVALPQVVSQMEWVEWQLADGRLFLLGDEAGLIDFSAYSVYFYLTSNTSLGPACLEQFPRSRQWTERVRAIGHGTLKRHLSPLEAIEIARQSEPLAPAGDEPWAGRDFAPGQVVEIRANDYGRDPVVGEVVSSTRQEVAIVHQDASRGRVVVHFPRVGYRVTRPGAKPVRAPSTDAKPAGGPKAASTHARTIVEAFREHAKRTPDRPLLSFVGKDGSDQETVTLRELEASADSIAAYLSEHARLVPGDRVLLVYPPSLDFVRAFLGALFAGVVPAPVLPPNPFGQDLSGFRSIAKSSGARAILSNTEYMRAKDLAAVKKFFVRKGDSWPDLPWHATDKVPKARHRPRSLPVPKPEDLAFLQYTSGSTSMPKGVMITHANLVHQLVCDAEVMGFDKDTRAVLWVPHYHDLGLIGGILNCLWGNGHLHLMSPLDFLQKPSRWMDVMSRVRATATAAPNFAYDLVARKTTPAERARWDLSALRVAQNAGEPVRPATLERFSEAFAASGFRPEAFCPAYGLAEHTVGISVGGRARLRVNRAALQRGRVEPEEAPDGSIELTGCGKPLPEVRVRIVDPETRIPCPAGQMGEIWVDSPSKTAGYYQREEETKEIFRARIEGEDEPTEYLRTGDLGFLHGGEIFVTGRCKDVMIVRGRNIHPEDVEESVRGSHPALRPGGIAVFSVPERIDEEGEERIVVVAEVRAKRLAPEEARAIVGAIAQRVRLDHEQACRTIVLGQEGLVLKTSSGKVRRRECRDAFLGGQMLGGPLVLHRARLDREPSAEGAEGKNAPAPAAAGVTGVTEESSKRSGKPVSGIDPSNGAKRPRLLPVEAVHAYLVNAIARQTGVPSSEIEIHAPLGIYPIDSLGQANLVSQFSDWLGWSLEPAIALRYPTIDELARYVVQADEEQSASRDGAAPGESKRMANGGAPSRLEP